MAYGFDSSIILSGKRADPLQSARSMMDILRQRQVMAADTHQQQRGQRLADILRANAGNMDAMPQALAADGHNDEALRWFAAKLRGEQRAPAQKTPQELALLAARAEKESAQAKALGRPRPAPQWASPKQGGKSSGGPKALAPSYLSELAGYDTAAQQVDELFDEYDKLDVAGAGGKAKGFFAKHLGLQGGDVAEYDAKSAPVRQAVGTILEGGKMAAGDEEKYRNMFPRPGDSKEVRNKKRAALKSYLETEKRNKTNAWKAGGYLVPDLNAKPGGANQSARVVVTNGVEEFEIDLNDLADAQADGYRVKK